MKNMYRIFLAALFRARGMKPPVFVSFYGDSITRGDFLAVRPVQRMTQLARGAFIGVDYASGGATVQDALSGKLPFGPWLEHIKTDKSQVIVIRYAGASALLGMEKIDEYEQSVTDMVIVAKRLGKKVVLTGMSWGVDPIPGLSQADSDRIFGAVTAYDKRTALIALKLDVPFIDLRAVPFYGASDMMDEAHPNQVYSDRLSQAIVAQLLPIVGAPCPTKK